MTVLRLDAVVTSIRAAADSRPDAVVIAGADDAATTPVTGIAHDSRRVDPGDLYCCVPGASTDGHEHAPTAVGAGAVALLCERPLGLGVPEVRVPSVRGAMGAAAAAIFDHPSDATAVVGVTGTNGKTTTTHLLGALLEAAGRRSAVIGTLTGARTTPEAPELQAELAGFVERGVDVVAMEVSSHALDQRRVDGTRFRVAAFTNLSPEHLDHHGSMEAYFQAKARLFTPALTDRAVVDLDGVHGRLLRDGALVPTVGYSLADAEDLVPDATGSSFRWRGQPVRLGLPGRFNVANALAAATIAAELGLDPDVIAVSLSAAGPVPGRVERIELGQPFAVVVDYAHTPDGIEKLLAAIRELGHGRVAIVFGCGGDRDRTKRPLMGAAAAAGADRVIVTSDNPRSEDPGAIISDVLTGIPEDTDLLIEPDRRAAIRAALDWARPGDSVVIAGKGHETTQTTGDQVEPFDDRIVSTELLGGAG